MKRSCSSRPFNGEWIDDRAFMRSYRFAWAKVYEARQTAHDVALRRAELAAHIELLDLPEGHPATLEAKLAMDEISPLEAIGVRAYIRHQSEMVA